MDRINAICEEVRMLTDEDFAEIEDVIRQQREYINPLKMATTAWQSELAKYNAKVLAKLRELQEVITAGATIEKPC